MEKKKVIIQVKMYQSVERHQSGRTSIVNEDHLGCTTTSQMLDDVVCVHDLVKEDS
jgi:hypothetical protein